MKSIKDIKKEYKEILVKKINTSYRYLKDNSVYHDEKLSPDTKKELARVEGKFKWYHTIKEKLEQKFDNWESPFDTTKYTKPVEINLLDMEDTTTMLNQTKKYDKSEHRFFFQEDERVKEIIADDILIEYPIFKTVQVIKNSTDSVVKASLRVEQAKTTSFENAIEQVENLVKYLTPSKILYSLDCNNVISVHKTLFKYCKNAEDKEEHVKAILKLRDQLSEHQQEIYNNYYDIDKINISNHKTFTAQSVNSEYSLTEEEARWWNNNKLKEFEQSKMFQSLGIKEQEVDDFIYWKKNQLADIPNESINKIHVNAYQQAKVFEILDDIVFQVEMREQYNNSLQEEVSLVDIIPLFSDDA